MDIPVFVEPTADGFRATSLTLGNVIAEGTTEADALAGVRAQVAARLRAGAKVVSLHLPDSPPLYEAEARITGILAAAAALAPYHDILDLVDQEIAEQRRREDEAHANRPAGPATTSVTPEAVTS